MSNKAGGSGRSPSPARDYSNLSHLNALMPPTSTFFMDPISDVPVVPVQAPRNRMLGTYRLEDSIGPNRRVSAEQRGQINRSRQAARLDPLGPPFAYGTALQSFMRREVEEEEMYRDGTGSDEGEEENPGEEDRATHFGHLPPVFLAEGESSSEEENTGQEAYDADFRNLIDHYSKTMGPPVTHFRSGREPHIPPKVAEKQAKARRLREHQLLNKVSRPLFPYSSRVARVGIRTEKEQKQIDRNKERHKKLMEEEADEQKKRRRQKDQQENFQRERRTAESFAKLGISPATEASTSESATIICEKPAQENVQKKIKNEPKTMQKCEKEGCIGGPYAVDKYDHVDLQSTGVEPEWPGLLETMHDSPISSRDISTFLTREATEVFALIDPVGTQQIKQICIFLDTKESRNEQAMIGDHSYIVDFSSFPQKISNRPYDRGSPLQKVLRPILLDGSGVAYAWDCNFAPKWYGATKNLHYQPAKVLPVYPLVIATLRLILLGHKVEIVLPQYYQEPYRRASKRLKVDNLYAFKKLVDLGLIKWLDEPRDSESSLNVMKQIENLAMENCACIIGHDRVPQLYNSDRGSHYNEIEDYTEYDVSELIQTSNTNVLAKDRARYHSSHRYLSVQFIGDLKDLVVYNEYNVFVGADRTDHDNRKQKYDRVEPEITMYYTDQDADIRRDDLRRVKNQLNFGQQIRLVLELADLYNLPQYELHGVMVFLRFACRQGFHEDLFNDFVSEHLPFPEPTMEDTTRVDLEPSFEPTCLVELDLNVDDELAREAIEMELTGEFGRKVYENDEEEDRWSDN